MAYIRKIEPASATGELKGFYDEFAEVSGGVPSIVKVSSLKLSAMRASRDLFRSVLHHESGLSMAQKEMVATLVSVINGCVYCVRRHAASLRELTNDAALAVSIESDYEQAAVDSRTMLILRFAEKLTGRPESMSEEDVETLREAGMTDEEVLDLVQLVSYFNYINRIATALGVESTDGID
jgi:uncharacterized peroxidase-related enzyme